MVNRLATWVLTTLDPDGTFVSQSKKYIDKLADTFRRLFNEDPPKGYKIPLGKMITQR